MDHSDEDTNGSFEMVDKVSDFSETDSDSKLNEDKNGTESDDRPKEGEWEDVLGSGHLLKKVSYGCFYYLNYRLMLTNLFSFCNLGH